LQHQSARVSLRSNAIGWAVDTLSIAMLLLYIAEVNGWLKLDVGKGAEVGV
jgi:hypothetical protein